MVEKSPVSEVELPQSPFLENGFRNFVLDQFVLDQHAIISAADLKGNITYVNNKFVEISGYSKAELNGQNHRIVKSEEHPSEFYKDLWRTLAAGQTWQGEIKNLKKNGDPYWVQATIVPRLNELGKPVEYISIRTDITDSKAAESLKQLKMSFDFIRSEVYMLWPDTLEFFYANRKALDQVGIKKEQIFSLTPTDVLKNSLTEAEFQDLLKPLREGREEIISFVMDRPGKDGEVFPAETLLQLVEPQGEKSRFIIVIRDITKRMQAEKAKSEFVATINHELRTPLTSIMGALGLIVSGAIGDDQNKVKSLVNLAYKNTERLKLMVDSLLDLEVIESGKIDIQVEKMDLSKLVKDSIDDNTGYGLKFGVSYITHGIENPVWVNADRNRLMQVMSNLLSNATKFSKKGNPVEISLTTDASMARISVKDFGPGIPEDARANIFEKFTQVDSSDTREKGGIGLGLNIAKQIVEALGGTIGFTSEVGKGSTFYFDLKR